MEAKLNLEGVKDVKNKDYTNKDEKDQSKKIVILIIIVIALLSLITSCSCTSDFFGKIGSSLSDSINNLFRNEDDYDIDDDTNDMETISNKELKFDMDSIDVSLDENNVKLSYTYSKIIPKKFTCSTSNASIATCYVENGYVVVKPKSTGTVTITLQTTVNGKTYEASTKVNVTEATRSIRLSSNSGVIDLSKGNTATISYSLEGLEGDVVVSSSNNSVAVATANNGVLYITALKAGNATITLSIISNGKEYTAAYNLSIVNKLSGDNSNSGNNQGNNGNNQGNGNSGNSGNNSNNPSNPGNPVNPDKPVNPENPETPGEEEDKKEYVLTTYQNKYGMSFSNGYGERNIVLNTNLFNGKTVELVDSPDKKKLLVCTSDRLYCITLTVDGNNDNANIGLEYVGELNDPSSLPFKITANSAGTSIIHVSGGANGKTIAEFTIEINVGEKYIVSLDSNGGEFNEFTKLYEFEVSHDEEIDLSEYDKPYKLSEDECVYYKFIGYSKTPNGEVEYSGDEVIKELDSSLTLYAIYDTNSTPITELELEKTLWVKDIPLFFNEEYYEKYKEDKVIYPGAYGTYTMNFTNKSSNKIVMTGLTLKEDTICVKEGCLNMGYMIKYSTPESEWKESYGQMGSSDKNAQYWIFNLNPGTTKISDAENSFKANIPFKDNEEIELKPNEEMQIVILWKWVDNDDLDTLIGEYAAKKLIDDNINDKYGLSIGINFETKIETCKQ